MESSGFQNISFDNLFEMPFHGRGISFENGLFLVGYQWVMGKICKGAFVIYSQDKKHRASSREYQESESQRQLNTMWAKLLFFISTLKHVLFGYYFSADITSIKTQNLDQINQDKNLSWWWRTNQIWDRLSGSRVGKVAFVVEPRQNLFRLWAPCKSTTNC